jgi:hypothetical protein
MSIRKFRSGRVPNATASTWVGEVGTMFYDETTGQLKIADGHTPGGRYINLVVATTTQLGGIKAGPGANVSVDGTLTINTAGLPLSIGDLSIIQANISTVNPNENLNLVSNGTGAVNVVGNLHIHTTSQNWFNDGPGATPVLSADNSGNVTTNGNLITNGDLIVRGPSFFYGNITEVGNLTITGKAINNGPSIFNGAMTIAGDTGIVGNISMTGNTNITGSAFLTGNTTVTGDTLVTGTTTVTGNTSVTGSAFLTGNTTVTGNTLVTGTTTVTGNTSVTGSAFLTGNTTVTGNTLVTGTTTVTGNTVVAGNTTVTGNTNVTGTAYLTGNSYIIGNTFVIGTTTVSGNTFVTGQVTTITGNTYLQGNSFIVGATNVSGNITVTGNSLQTGQATFIITVSNSNLGAVEITGNSKGLSQTPQNTGVMLHATGPDSGNTSSRIYVDSVGNYTVIAGRRYNGTIANPTQILANQDIIRWGGTAYAAGGWPTIGPNRISYVANEDFTATNQGGRIELWTTPNGTVASTNISRTAVIDPAIGVTAIGFSTAGNVTAANVNATTVYGNVVGSVSNLKMDGTSIGTFLAGQVNIPAQTIPKNTTSVDVTVTVTGLTAGHKVIVTPAADLNSGIFVTAAYPSGSNTLGIQMQNTTGGALTTSAFNLTYMAWI